MLLAYTPFVQPLPFWGSWYLWAIPLCAALSIVYKSIRCAQMKQVPRVAAVIFVASIGGMLLAAGVLMLLVKWMV